jgi:HPt (histidine-containing phosphotransfer) domain-containing protein
MFRICPTCLHQNDEDSPTCNGCSASLLTIRKCSGCGATAFDFASFCYHCGLRLKAGELAKLTPKPTVSLITPSALRTKPLDLEGEDDLATTFRNDEVRLFHCASSTFFELPSLVRPILIGKRSETEVPDLDLRDWPQSGFISRIHAQITVEYPQFYIEDLDSKNGTAVNGISLPSGQPQLLAFGDRIRLGNAEAFTFVFIKNQPIDLDRLKLLSGDDRAFELELLTAYLDSVAGLLDTLQPIIQRQAFDEIQPLAHQIAIASYNVGADVMNLLAKQLDVQALQQAAACQKTLAALQEGLVQVHYFVKVFYAS